MHCLKRFAGSQSLRDQLGRTQHDPKDGLSMENSPSMAVCEITEQFGALASQLPGSLADFEDSEGFRNYRGRQRIISVDQVRCVSTGARKPPVERRS
jgi:hypothetical protein